MWTYPREEKQVEFFTYEIVKKDIDITCTVFRNAWNVKNFTLSCIIGKYPHMKRGMMKNFFIEEHRTRTDWLVLDNDKFIFDWGKWTSIADTLHDSSQSRATTVSDVFVLVCTFTNCIEMNRAKWPQGVEQQCHCQWVNARSPWHME